MNDLERLRAVIGTIARDLDELDLEGEVTLLRPDGTPVQRTPFAVREGRRYLPAGDRFVPDPMSERAFDLPALERMLDRATSVSFDGQWARFRLEGDAAGQLFPHQQAQTGAPAMRVDTELAVNVDGALVTLEQRFALVEGNETLATVQVVLRLLTDRARVSALANAADADRERRATIERVLELVERHVGLEQEAIEIAYNLAVEAAGAAPSSEDYRVRRGVAYRRGPAGTWEPVDGPETLSRGEMTDLTRALLALTDDLALVEQANAIEARFSVAHDMLAALESDLGGAVRAVAAASPGCEARLYVVLRFLSTGLLERFDQELWVVDPAALPETRERIFRQALVARVTAL